MMTKQIPSIVLMVAVVVGMASATAAQKGPVSVDFGDAPDLSDVEFDLASPGGLALPSAGQYPTLDPTDNALSGRTGPFHSLAGPLLGDMRDGESTAHVIDLDSFDDGFRGFVFVMAGVPVNSWINYKVTLPDGAPTGDYYLNVAIDLNKDGKWAEFGTSAGEREWVVRDQVVNFTTAGTSQVVSAGPFFYGNGIVFGYPTWIRATLTATALTPGFSALDWDGSGPMSGFDYGETEDLWFRGTGGPPGEGGGEREGEGEGYYDYYDYYDYIYDEAKTKLFIKFMPRRILVGDNGAWFCIKVCNPTGVDLTDVSVGFGSAGSPGTANGRIGFGGGGGGNPQVVDIPAHSCVWVCFFVQWTVEINRTDTGTPFLDPPFAQFIEFVDSPESAFFSSMLQVTSPRGAMLTATTDLITAGSITGSNPILTAVDVETIPVPTTIQDGTKGSVENYEVVYAVDFGPDDTIFDPPALIELPIFAKEIEALGLSTERDMLIAVKLNVAGTAWNVIKTETFVGFPSDGGTPLDGILAPGSTLSLETESLSIFGLAALVPAVEGGGEGEGEGASCGALASNSTTTHRADIVLMAGLVGLLFLMRRRQA